MRTLFVVIVLVLVGIVGVGFYRGWFSLSTNNAERKPGATFTVDKDKIHADEELAKEKMHELRQDVKARTDAATEKVTD